MPFIGQDWRSPGEVWIKTDEGWERMKLLRKSHLIRHQASIENGAGSPPGPFALSTSLSSSPGSAISLRSTSSSSSGSESDSDVEGCTADAPLPADNLPGAFAVEDFDASGGSSSSVGDILSRLQKSSSQPIPVAILRESSELMESELQGQPYCRITLNPTKEVAGSNIISDAFYKLDFCNAIRDIRRFAYVSKLLHLLITQNLTSLSGNATKALFWMLEEIAKQVATNKQNIHVIRKLLVELREIVDKYLCWGRPLGSTALWEQHLRTMERICEMTTAIDLQTPEDESKPSWSELPEELIREILLRLSDYKDLERCEDACDRMNSLLTSERHIWKQLCKYHFSKEQLKWALHTAANATPALHDKVYDPQTGHTDWEFTFHLLRKKFGLKEEYADCLFLCRYCRCLFWKSKGHPCILENPELTRQLTSSVSNTARTRKSDILAAFRKETPLPSPATFSSPQVEVPVTAPSVTASLPPASSRSRNLSSPSVPLSVSMPPLSAHQQQQLPQGPVAVQNNPLFEHPLVLQQQRRQEQQPEQRQPFADIRQRFQNGQQAAVAPAAVEPASAFPKAPLYVPITPHAFLKYFSL